MVGVMVDEGTDGPEGAGGDGGTKALVGSPDGDEILDVSPGPDPPGVLEHAASSDSATTDVHTRANPRRMTAPRNVDAAGR